MAARKEAKPKKRVRPRLPGQLNATERAVRRMLVASEGKVTDVAIAEKLGCSPALIWRSRKQIEKIYPLPDLDESIGDEIRAALKTFDDLEQYTLQSIQDAASRLNGLEKKQSPIGLMRLQTKMTDQLLKIRTDRIEFLRSVGVIEHQARSFLNKYRAALKVDDGQIENVLAVPILPGEWEVLYGGNQPDAPGR